jgi:hypothetical protein
MREKSSRLPALFSTSSSHAKAQRRKAMEADSELTPPSPTEEFAMRGVIVFA